MTTLPDRHQRVADGFAHRLALVGPDDWTRATPCSDWDVRGLVGHVIDEQLWIAPLLGGETIAEVGDRFAGDQLGHDAAAAWSRAVGQAQAAMAAPGALDGTVHLSYGDEKAHTYLWQIVSDTLLHTWDLARALGADEELGVDDVDAVAAFLGPQAEAWRAAGAFAEAVPVQDGADRQTRLLALAGRQA